MLPLEMKNIIIWRNVNKNQKINKFKSCTIIKGETRVIYFILNIIFFRRGVWNMILILINFSLKGQRKGDNGNLRRRVAGVSSNLVQEGSRFFLPDVVL